jgi:hypothetical protein
VGILSQLTQILVERLEKKEMQPSIIPGFIRDLATTVLINPDMSHFAVNRHLHLLGWDDFELDYHTLQLAIACFEDEGLAISQNATQRLTEIASKFHCSGANSHLSPVMTV